jgi:putative transposase
MGRTRYRLGDHSFPHFLTCTVVGSLPVFTRPDTVQILLNSRKFLQDHNRLVFLGYFVRENHIHFLASAENLAKEVMRLTGSILSPGITPGWSRWSMLATDW